MRIKTKLSLSSTILATVTAIIVIISFITSNMTEKKFTKIIEVDQKVIYNLTQLETLLSGISNDQRGFLLTGNSDYTDSLEAKQEAISKLLAETKTLVTTEEDLKVLNQIESGYVIYTGTVTEVLNKLGYDTGFYKAVPFRVYEAAFNQEREVRKSFNTLIEQFTVHKNETLDKQAQQIADSSRFQNLLILVIGLAAVVYFAIQGYLLTRSIQPLNQMSEQLMKMAEGGGDLVTRLPVTNKDEIGAVAEGYNKLVDGLRGLVVELQSTAEQVSVSAATLQSTTEEIRQASQHTSGIMEELAAGVENQLQDTEVTTNTITDMAAGMKQIAIAAQDVSGLAATTNQLAAKGAEALVQTLTQMDGMHSNVERSAESVRMLGDKAANIGAMGQIIIEIAEQTSLLALNASIEAARAGEYGRGFAVVAAEVRNLADQASESSVEIRQFVQDLQQDIYRLAEVMELGTREIPEGILIAQEAERAFKDIEQSVNELHDQIEGVTAATEQMNAGSGELVGAIQRIQEVTETTAGGTQSVSAATEEQLASMEEITSSVEDLNMMSSRLRQLMSGFKV